MLNIVKNPISYSKVIKQRKRNLSIPACALCGKLRALDWYQFGYPDSRRHNKSHNANLETGAHMILLGLRPLY